MRRRIRFHILGSLCFILSLTGCELLSPNPKPAALVFSVEPAGVAGGVPFATQPAVRIQDADGHDITGGSYAVTIALGANPGGATLAGTLTVTSVDGLASFTGLWIDKAGSGYTLVASLDSISSTSTAFDVAVGPATALRFVAQPQGAWDTGAPFDSQPSVEVVDAGGNRVTTAADTVGLSIATNPSGATLSGTTTLAAMAGLVAFTNLSVDRSGTGYTLVASAPGRSSATSAPFTVRRWTGQIQIAVTTTGLDFDPDGYLVQVDSGAWRALPVNGTTLLDSVPPGTRHLRLGGAAFNCALGDTTADVSVQSGLTGQLSVTATCRRYLNNEVLIESDQSGVSEIVLMNPDGSGRTQLTDRLGTMAAVSPDGLTIAFSSYDAGAGFGIYLMGADGTGVRKFLQRSSYDGRPAWSPDGRRLAFESLNEGPDGAYDRIWLVNADGTGLRQVSPDTGTSVHVFDSAPTWFPDGHRILYDRSGHLFIVDADQGGVTPVALPDSLIPVNQPRLSPDGTRIAFVSPVPASVANDDIYVANVDGSNIVRLTTDPASDEQPVWSPDGTRLLFARVVNGNARIYMVDAAAGGETSLGPAVGWSEYPDDWAKAK